MAGFGTGGTVTTDFAGMHDRAYGVTVQSDGKILVVGSANLTANNSTYDDLGLARYNVDGSLDTSFSADGKVTLDLGGRQDLGLLVSTDSNGSVYVGGLGYQSGLRFFLTKFTPQGALDTSFGSNGTWLLEGYIAPTQEQEALGEGIAAYLYDFAVLPAGKILVMGVPSGGTGIELMRLNSDGSFDNTFSGDGKLNLGVVGFSLHPKDVAIDGQGRVVVVGRGTTNNDGNYDFLVTRFNSDGTLDTSFSGDGFAFADLGSSDDEATSVSIDVNGRIIVGGWSGSGGLAGLVRFNENGTLDTSFSADGKLTTSLNSNLNVQVLTQQDGSVLLAGSNKVLKYTSSGELDASFASGGSITSAYNFQNWDEYPSHRIATQSDGKILSVGGQYSGMSLTDYAVTRFNSDGSIDTVSLPTDSTPPSISLVSPSDGATSVQIGSNFVLTFTEVVQAGTGSFVLKNGSTTIGSIDVTDTSQVTISGNQVTINPLNDLSYGTNYTVISPLGIIKDVAGNSWAGTSTYDFTTASNPIVSVSVNGGIGNDLINSTHANEHINAGAGLDTVVYFGLFSQYQINAQTGVVTDTQANRDGSDTLSNVERLKFSDINLAFDSAAGQIAGEAYRIYKAAFDRAPDAGGLGFWINAMDDGASLLSVAAGFISSPEFQKLYGANVSDRDYVTKLYNNVLDRNPDQGGYDFWLGALANGASREDILVNFSESKENIANVADLIANGIQYQEWLG